MSAFDAVHEVKVPFVGAPIHQALVPDEDVHHFGISHPDHVDLVASPLATEKDLAHGHGTHPGISHEGEASGSQSSTHSNEKFSDLSDDEPVLKRPHEAPTIQLFFDLYFVANLTTFSGQHEIHDWDALRSYIGYFTMIWFTWFQNTMFDVRFSNDSVLERCFKAAQFGIMTGFAITGPGYQTGFDPNSPDAVLALSAFQTLSLILMVSRLILTAQYGVALIWLRNYKKALLPIISHMAILFCTSMVYLGLYFAFHESGTEKVLAGWYVTFVVEAWAILLISGHKKFQFMSFKNTVLVERLGLLTLIILGEGIISMSNALNASNADNYYDSPIIAQIICCVVVAYLIYMLYFDNVQPKRMGSMRQHIWAVLHFPFHCAIVLVVEAMAQFAIWTKIVAFTRPLLDATSAVDKVHPTTEQVNDLAKVWNEVAGHFNLASSQKTIAHFISEPDFTEQFKYLNETAAEALAAVRRRAEGLALNGTAPEGGAEEPHNVTEALSTIYNEGVAFVCNKFRIEVATGEEAKEQGLPEPADQIFAIFQVVYIYFFCFAGLVLVVLSVLFLIGKRHKLRGELIGAALRFLAGLGLISLAALSHNGIPDNDTNDALHNYMYSGMVLPTVLIVYLVVLITDNILVRYVKSVVHWRLHLHHHGKTIPEIERPDYSAPEASTSANEHHSAPVSPVEESPSSPKQPTTGTAQVIGSY